ncbi:hypothetical protein CSV79_12895 [Sporosarcina sp. P13]|uniref:hypothetical protein n=1 Tax=Sporosarcina sp. P13 TaxID=2048263 RepID=UPI000C168CE0|nr:hypothetical protein [Sporosarcina sp. P13]PIC63234.1 hypothetical protein CSV79_12895 [Sporosarcina sp. P13]
MDIENTINITDSSIVSICNKIYGVNKGIFNKIDEWFYHIGVVNIKERRRTILLFMEHIQLNKISTQSTVPFGSGGLRIMFDSFVESNIGSTNENRIAI